MYIFLITLIALLALHPFLHHQEESIPRWIKKDANLWYDGKITEYFCQGIELILQYPSNVYD